MVWLPLVITIWVLVQLFFMVDSVPGGLLVWLASITPEGVGAVLLQLRNIPGLGLLMVFALLLVTGWLVSNVAGRWWFKQWDKLFTNIPIFKSIYSSVKKVSDTLFSSNGNAFRTAVLVQYPRAGSWTIGFQTGVPSGEVASHLGNDLISIYVPTTPNPTSGFFLMVPRADVIELSMSVDQALTYVISMGSVVPGSSAAAAEEAVSDFSLSKK